MFSTTLASRALLLPALLGAGLVFSGCRGQTSEKPPIHLNPNMDQVPRFESYESNAFFPDRRDMRPLVEGAVANQHQKDFGAYLAATGPNPVLDADRAYFQGHVDSQFVRNLPIKLTMDVMERGRERYEIYCTVCHGPTGSGNGIVVQRGFVPPPSLFEERVVVLPDGQIFAAVTGGVRTMPGYGKQIPAADRWAIVAYVRALQRARNAAIDDVPPAQRNNLR